MTDLVNRLISPRKKACSARTAGGTDENVSNYHQEDTGEEIANEHTILS